MNKLFHLLIVLSAFFLSGCLSSTESTFPQTSLELLQQSQYNGAAYIRHNGLVQVNEGFGYSNATTSTYNTINTRYRISILTTQFVAAGVLLLHRDSLIHLDSNVNTYLGNFPQGDSITVRQLLTQQSGLQSYRYTISVAQDSLEQIVDDIRNTTSRFTPGSNFEISNSNYILLGLLIERVTSQRYHEFLKEKIFDPLKMFNTTFSTDSSYSLVDAVGYENYAFTPSTLYDLNLLASANGAISTISDLLLWVESLKNNTLLSTEEKELMLTPTSTTYALGWGITSYNGSIVYSNYGETTGFKALLYWQPSTDTVVLLGSNMESFNMPLFYTDLLRLTYQ